MTRRTTLTLPLVPVAGARFQPTGFPNLGAAVFPRLEDGVEIPCLHVESPQSMANRFEETTWRVAEQRPVEAFDAIPYVEVVDPDGEFLTSSRLEAHRLASAYIMDGSIDGEDAEKVIERKLGLVAGKPTNHREVARAIFDLDPLSLVHGVFFARKSWPTQPKVARAITSFIDADDVRVAASGGVKTDGVNQKTAEGRGAESGYGMVPHLRTEYTARAITAYVTVDHEQLRSYGLGDERTELLEAIIDYELSHFFNDEGMRLRTACDLKVVDLTSLPTPTSASTRLEAAVAALGGQFAPRTVVVWSGPKGKA
ncbi:type I-G CRISPR-associated RAMP protein Csb1/Cas7g [Propionicicella superfundia]|uniref:type I-G CRISPR-associated RAMP protein Csb1/Cas7g n=1 Tax=Propionicicella superfundia TaxID=348582 RepID=UPI00040C6588|nr:type I-U CRISPR-associated RAMP protein Csb1/Cas7u [Propionicicella superfundia]